jgi:hypothetical protein
MNKHILFQVYRNQFTPNCTTGTFKIYPLPPKNGGDPDPIQTFYSYEPANRAVKIPKKTCIPEGEYKLRLYFSPKRQANVFMLVNVPNFTEIEIHSGNNAQDTEGCILVGNDLDLTSSSNSVTLRQSRKALNVVNDYQKYLKNKKNIDFYIKVTNDKKALKVY